MGRIIKGDTHPNRCLSHRILASVTNEVDVKEPKCLQIHRRVMSPLSFCPAIEVAAHWPPGGISYQQEEIGSAGKSIVLLAAEKCGGGMSPHA